MLRRVKFSTLVNHSQLDKRHIKMQTSSGTNSCHSGPILPHKPRNKNRTHKQDHQTAGRPLSPLYSQIALQQLPQRYANIACQHPCPLAHHRSGHTARSNLGSLFPQIYSCVLGVVWPSLPRPPQLQSKGRHRVWKRVYMLHRG